MTELAYPLPEIGEPSLAADPRTLEALINIKAWAQGQIDSTNLKALGVAQANLAAESVSEAKLTKEVAELLNNKTAGGETKKSIIATEQSRENAAFGTLATPDEVTVTMPTNGLIAVNYEATWKPSVEATIKAGLFLGATQVKRISETGLLAPVESAPLVVTAKVGNWGVLTTRGNGSTGFEEGLVTSDFSVSYGGGVTTGQLIGSQLLIQAAAGSYKLTVQFSASTGKVTVKNRKLWALAIA